MSRKDPFSEKSGYVPRDEDRRQSDPPSRLRYHVYSTYTRSRALYLVTAKIFFPLLFFLLLFHLSHKVEVLQGHVEQILVPSAQKH